MVEQPVQRPLQLLASLVIYAGLNLCHERVRDGTGEARGVASSALLARSRAVPLWEWIAFDRRHVAQLQGIEVARLQLIHERCPFELTDDHLDVVAGRRDQLVGRIQETYGIARDEAERQVSDWESRNRDLFEDRSKA